jgi:hypothetical protein
MKQMAVKYTNWPLKYRYQMTVKIYQIVVKIYLTSLEKTLVFNSKAFQNIPKLRFVNIPSGNPGRKAANNNL